MGKGSGRRPGQGYEASWDMIFGTKQHKPADPPKPSYEELERQVAQLKAELRRLQEDAVWDRM